MTIIRFVAPHLAVEIHFYKLQYKSFFQHSVVTLSSYIVVVIIAVNCHVRGEVLGCQAHADTICLWFYGYSDLNEILIKLI